ASPSWSASWSSKPYAGLDRLHVGGVRALGPDLGVVAHLRALGERLEAAAGDAGVMHEQVLALIVGRYEAEALVVAEPLHGSCSHLSLPGGHVRRYAGGARATTTNAGTDSPGATRRALPPSLCSRAPRAG